MYYFNTGFTALSIQFESANDNGGTPGAFNTFGGPVVGTGVNPSTNTTSAAVAFNGGTAATVYAWTRVNLVSATGTGTVTGVVLGTKITSGTSFPSFASGACGKILAAVCTAPSLARFVWRNQQSAQVVSFGGGSENLNADRTNHSGDTLGVLTGREISAPTAPWRITVAFLPGEVTSGTPFFESGIYVLDGTGKAIDFAWASTNHTYVLWYDTWTSTSVPTVSRDVDDDANTEETNGGVLWLRLVNDGTNFIPCKSPDGYNFSLFYPTLQKAVGAFIGAPTKVGYFMSILNGNYYPSLSIVSWTVDSGSTC